MSGLTVKRVKIKGVAKWAKIQKPQYDEHRGGDYYSIDVSVTDEDVKNLIKVGMKIGKGGMDTKLKVDGDINYLTFRRPKLSKKTNEPLKELIVVGPDRKDYKGLVGNGSEVVAHIDILNGPKFKRPSPRLVAVQIAKLVEYGSNKLDFDDFGEGIKEPEKKEEKEHKEDTPDFDDIF